jgi:hypothetical protein
MNTKIIRVRFSHFLGEFEKNEFKMVMQFLKLVLMEYDENPLSILGKKCFKDFLKEIQFVF